MKTKKVVARLAFLGIFCLLTQACASEETKPNYELISCKDNQDSIDNIEWLQEIIKTDLRRNFPRIKIYSGYLGKNFVYITDTVVGEQQEVYFCNGKLACGIVYDGVDNDQCATMLKSITNKKLIYQH
jgi:hypothetical protein